MTRLYECDREHVTEATLTSLVRERHERREEVEVLEARIADLESKLTECMAAIDRAHATALEVAASIADGFSGPTAVSIAELIRRAKVGP